MPRRAFLPPAVCNACHQRPAVGHALCHTGRIWLCPACLSDNTSGRDTISKMGSESLQANRYRSLSRRAKAANEIENGANLDNHSRWHGHKIISIRDHGEQLAQEAVIVNGEAITPGTPSWMKDTLADRELSAIDSSHTRGDLLQQNDILALGIDVSLTIGATNTLEKLLSHEIALAHKIAFQQAANASSSMTEAIELKRLQVSARMMKAAQQGILALQKLKTGGTQNVVVQHVHVERGGQAVIGAVQTGGRGRSVDSCEE